MKVKKLTFNQFWDEVEKLKKKALKLNKVSGNLMVTIVTRIKKNK